MNLWSGESEECPLVQTSKNVLDVFLISFILSLPPFFPPPSSLSLILCLKIGEGSRFVLLSDGLRHC